MGIGLVIWLVALRWPFRAMHARPELSWDVAGYVASFAFSIAIALAIEAPLLRWAEGEVEEWYRLFHLLPGWAALLSYIVVSDLGAYWAHRFLHTQLLWDSHAWHHSPRYLYFLSGTRAAPVHILVLIAPYTLAYLWFPPPTAHYVFLAQAAFQVANQHYLHSNLKVPWAKTLEWLFVTPRFHFVHHARSRIYSDSNYGFIFSIWDRLFGTYTDPDVVPADEPLGLNYEASNARLLFGLPGRRV